MHEQMKLGCYERKCIKNSPISKLIWRKCIFKIIYKETAFSSDRSLFPNLKFLPWELSFCWQSPVILDDCNSHMNPFKSDLCTLMQCTLRRIQILSFYLCTATSKRNTINQSVKLKYLCLPIVKFFRFW